MTTNDYVRAFAGAFVLISLALGMGFLIAVTRKRPRTEVLMDASLDTTSQRA